MTKLDYEILKIDHGDVKVPAHFLTAIYSYLEAELNEWHLSYKGEKKISSKN
jgi:hypothetical protein